MSTRFNKYKGTHMRLFVVVVNAHYIIVPLKESKARHYFQNFCSILRLRFRIVQILENDNEIFNFGFWIFMKNSVDLPPEKKIEKNNVNNMQNIGTKVL